MGRQEKIIKTSTIGIIVNLILVAFKTVIGILTNSIAITLDAINNLTDALSSIITIIGIKLAGKAPDKDHPYGHGRIEYFSSFIIAVIVLWAGISALMESWPKIFTPDITNYTTIPLLVIAVAVIVKFVIGIYIKRVGEKINSLALVASGKDSFLDGILSASTLIAAIISIYFNISLEGILGVIISIVIIKTSIDILKESFKSIIGTRVDSELSHKIKESICEFPHVYGAYDLILHDYGPERFQGSVQIEVDDDLTATEIHLLSNQISIKIIEEFSVFLSIGIYARNNKYTHIRDYLYKIASEYEEILEIHGFLVNEKYNLITFNIIIDFDADRIEIKNQLLTKIRQKYPEFNYYVIDDYDISD